MTLQLELIRGRSNDGTRVLDAPGTFVVGSSVRSDWRVVARGVRPNHFVLSWDGVALVVRSACEPGSVEVDDRVVTTPFAISGLARVRFGEAVVRVLPTPVRDDTPTLHAALGAASSNDDASDDDGSNDVTRMMPVIHPLVVTPPLPVTRREGPRAKPPLLPEPHDEHHRATPPLFPEMPDRDPNATRTRWGVGEVAAPIPSAGAETCREGVTPVPDSYVTEEITDVEPESDGRVASLRALARAFAARPRWVVGAAAMAASTFVASAWAVHAHRASVSHDAAAPVVASSAAATPSPPSASAATVAAPSPAGAAVAEGATVATATTPLTVPTLPRPAEQSAHPTTAPTTAGGAPETSPVSPDIAAKLLAAGEHDDAERAYAELAKRYPDEPVYRVIASALSSDSSVAARGKGTER